MCKAHYNRWLKHGDPQHGGALRTKNGAGLDWVKRNTGFDGEDCLLWPFARDDAGRGKIHLNGKSTSASRVMCELVRGPAPSQDHHAAHRCGNGHLGCVNPGHLRWATPKENADDKFIHGTQVIGQRCNSAKLDDADAAEILRLKGSGIKQQELADKFGVHQTTISDIWSGRRRSWMEVTR
jgi:hypothetical protein